MNRRIPVFRIVEWRDAEVDPEACTHPTILRFVGACDHVAYRCVYCDRRLDIAPHVYESPA